MIAQLAVALFLAATIIFVPYFIGCLISKAVKREFIFETIIHNWLFGVMALIVSGLVIGTLILMGKGLWIAAGHLLGN
jgi:hypothetical protein